MIRNGTVIALLLLASCAGNPGLPSPVAEPAVVAPPVVDPPVVEHWGGMREVLRDGETEGRVVLSDVIGPHTFAVGALEGLAAEITVVAGTAHLAEVVDPDTFDGLRVREPLAGEQATLLVLADVTQWAETTLPALADLGELEAAVREAAVASDIDVTEPFPFRVEGMASALELHVLNHSCPIADPDGPHPWRFAGADEAVVLVGFYAEDAACTLTHHGQQSHTHALVTDRDVSGHVDDVDLPAGARLFLPGR